MRELLEHFGHKSGGNAVLFGNFVGATSVLLAVHGQVLDGDQAVIRFFGKLKHGYEDFLYVPRYATESVAHEVYARKGCKVKLKPLPPMAQAPYF